jgi:hypothetical protein
LVCEELALLPVVHPRKAVQFVRLLFKFALRKIQPLEQIGNCGAVVNGPIGGHPGIRFTANHFLEALVHLIAHPPSNRPFNASEAASTRSRTSQ